MLAVEDIPLGLYIKKDTLAHRCQAGPKLLVLAIFLVTSTIFAKTFLTAIISVGVVTAFYLIAQIPARTAYRQLRGSAMIVAFFGVLLWWRTDFEQATVTSLVIFSAIAAAVCFTLTTRVSELIDTVERILSPLSKVGVNVPAAILAISLTIRLIPLQVMAVAQVLEARRSSRRNSLHNCLRSSSHRTNHTTRTSNGRCVNRPRRGRLTNFNLAR